MRTTWALVGMVVGCGGSTPLYGYGTPPDATRQDGADSGAVAFVPDEASFSAAFFVEAYCSGCHQPSFVAPNGDSVAIFSQDPAWQEPFQRLLHEGGEVPSAGRRAILIIDSGSEEIPGRNR